MYAQFTYFDGPRSPELVAADDRAGTERIDPMLMNDPVVGQQLVALLVCRRDDGGQIVVSVTETREALERARDLIMTSELLPGEDPALLPGADRVEVLSVVKAKIPAGLPS